MSELSSNCIEKISLIGLFARYRIVIPEIQREYVWGDPSLGSDVLGNFLDDLLKHLRGYDSAKRNRNGMAEKIRKELSEKIDWNICPTCPTDKTLDEVSRKLAESVEGARNSLDVQPGFIYAYVPGYVNGAGSERLTAFLIDGQQRVTTCFLVWLYLARKSGTDGMTEFLKNIGHTVGIDDMAFTFRVRQLTHEFLLKLVDDAARPGSPDYNFSNVEDRHWFLSEFRDDVSILNMVNALKTWDVKWNAEVRENPTMSPAVCRDFMAMHVSLWMYVVNETAQGEQLYITMNGRGRSLSRAEIVKAKIFSEATCEESAGNSTWGIRVGKLFEDIYDFFWRKRAFCIDADEGVQKFLHWACILNFHLQGRKEDAQKLLKNKDLNDKEFKLGENLFDVEMGGPSVSFLSKFFSAMEFLDGIVNDAKLRNYKLFPETAYVPPVKDPGRFQQDTFVILPVLYWLMQKANVSKDATDGWETFQYGKSGKWDVEVARILHFLKAQCSRENIEKSINSEAFSAIELLQDFVSQDKDWLEFVGTYARTTAILTEEERSLAERLTVLAKTDMEAASSFEKVIWKIQDFRVETVKADCGIDKFLSSQGDWRKQSWTKDIENKYVDALAHFEKFLKMRSDGRNALRIMTWLMHSDHRGYWEYGNDKLFPHSDVSLFDSPEIVNAISSLMENVQKCGESVFDDQERVFLMANGEKVKHADCDIFTITTWALIASRLVLNESKDDFNANLTKLQYSAKYYDHQASGDKWSSNGLVPIGGRYLWHTERGTCRIRPTSSCYSNLFACYKVSRDRLEDLVKKFCEQGVQED